MNKLPTQVLRDRALAEVKRRIEADRIPAARLCVRLGVPEGLHSRILHGTPPSSVAVFAITMLRVLRGMPRRLRADEVKEVLSALDRWPTFSAAAAACGYSSQQIANIRQRQYAPSVKLWALLFPERIGCEDIIESPLRAKKGAVAA